MRFERGLLAACWMTCACGPVVGDDDDHGRVCGQPSPVRLLAHDESEAVGALGPARLDDRFYFAVGRAAPVDDEYGFPTFELDDSRVVSMGTCGESQEVVAQDIPYVYTDERFPGALLGRNLDDDGVVLDPSGATPPKIFEPAFDGPSTHTDAGVLAVIAATPDATSGALVLQPYPAQLGDAVPEPVVLLDDISTQFSSLVARDVEAIALDVNGGLFAIDLASFAATRLAEDVDGFLAATDGSSVVLLRDVDMAGFGSATLLERATGVETQLLDDAGPPAFGFMLYADEIVLGRAPSSGFSQRVIALPELAGWDLPAGHTFLRRIDERTLLLRGTDQGLFRFDQETGEETVLFDGWVWNLGLFDDHAELFVPEGSGNLFDANGELWNVPYSGDEAELVASHVGSLRRKLADGRIVTLVDVDETSDLGMLELIDPATHERRVLDESVYVIGIEGGNSDILDDGLVLYDVRDGDRSGIWLARP